MRLLGDAEQLGLDLGAQPDVPSSQVTEMGTPEAR